MKSKLLLILLALGGAVLAHAEKIVTGPKGGRLLDTAPLKAEFFVTVDRKVEITLLDDHQNPVIPGTQVIAVTAEPASGRVTLEMAKTDAGFASKSALPAGEPYRVVVQFREKPDAKPKNFRIDFNLEQCGECKHAEYACTCEGH